MESRRITRERKTVESMVRIFCRDVHKAGSNLCPVCTDLLTYAQERLTKCPFQERKTTCSHCRVHCYKPDMREKIREIMRFSGPRMLFRHPFLSCCHMLDGRRKEPTRQIK